MAAFQVVAGAHQWISAEAEAKKSLDCPPIYFVFVHAAEQSCRIELISEENKPEDKLQECTWCTPAAK